MPVLGVHCVVLDAGSAEDVSRVVAALNSDSRVAWAQRMGQFRTLGGSADAEGAAAAWRQLDALHRLSTGRRVVIAQVDTGVDLGHPALAGQWSDPQNFVGGGRFPGELHGTGVAGVIVAHGDTSVGIVGVAPGARLMPLRACWQAEAQGALCSSFTLAKSVQYALRHGARIINLSLAGPHDLLLERLIDSAVAAGAIVVAAAEEDAADPGFPASHPQVIAVARKASGASPRSMLIAPGDDVLTTAPHGTFAFLSGSSFAAAHITGLTALILELSPRLSAAQVASLLRDSSSATADAGGPKVIDPCAALTAVSHAAGQPMCARLDEPIARRAARF
jgi:subtilisin family serine protease